MAVFKPTNCSPYLTAFDITYLGEGPIYFQCKIDTSNTKIDGYAITIYDNDNNQVFPFNGNTIDNMSYIEDLRKDTIRIDSPIKTNGISDLNTGLNGTYLKIPFVVKQSDFSSFAETTKNNMVYYDSSNKIIKDKSGNTIELTNGSQYKWSISLYQLGENAIKANKNRPEDDKYYDMTVATGKILGSTNERIQTYPSEEIYNDYFVQLYNKADGVELDNEYKIAEEIDEDKITQVGTRVRVKDYDSYLGHIYPQTGQDGFSQEEINQANLLKIFKMSDNPDDLSTKDKVDFCVTKTYFIPKYFYDSSSDSTTSFLKQIFFVGVPSETTDDNKIIDIIKNVYNKPFSFCNNIIDGTIGKTKSRYYAKTAVTVQEEGTPTVSFDSTRIVLNTEWGSFLRSAEINGNEINEDGSVANEKTEANSDSSGYNGIWIPKTPTIDTKTNFISGNYKYCKVTIQWYRASDADTFGELTNKIVLDTNQLDGGYDDYAGDNVQAYSSAQEGEYAATGTINETPIKFNLEKAIEIYPNQNEKYFAPIYELYLNNFGQMKPLLLHDSNDGLTFDYKGQQTWEVNGIVSPNSITGKTSSSNLLYKIESNNPFVKNVGERYQIAFVCKEDEENKESKTHLFCKANIVLTNGNTEKLTAYAGYATPFNITDNLAYIEIRIGASNEGSVDFKINHYIVNMYFQNIANGNVLFIAPSTAISIGDKIFNKYNNSSEITSLDTTVWAVRQSLNDFNISDPYSIKTFFRSSSENQFNLYSRPTVTIKLESASGGVAPQPEPEINPKRYLVNERSIIGVADYQQTNLIQWRNYQWFLYDGDYSGENKDLNSSDIILQSQVGYDKEIKYTFYGLAEDNHDYTIVLVLTDQYGTIITVKQLIHTNFNNGQGIDIVREDEWANYGLRCDLTAVDIWFTDKAGYIFPNLQDRNYLYTENNYANNPYGVTYDIQNSVMNIGDDSDGVLYDCVYGNLGTSSYNVPSKYDLEFDEEKGISFKTQMQINTKQYDAEFLNVIIDGSDNFSSKTLSVKIADFYIPQDQWPDGIIGGFPNQNSAFIQKIQNGVANETWLGLPNSTGEPYGRSRSTTDLWPSSYGIKQSDTYNYLPINIIPFWTNTPNISSRSTWFFIDYSSNGMKTLISEKPIEYKADGANILNDIDLIYEFPIYTKGRNPIYSGGKNPYVLGNFIDGARTYSIWQDTNEKIIVSTTFNIVIGNNEVQAFYANRLANNAPEFIKDNIWNDTYIDSDGIEHDYYWDDGNDPEFTDLINIRNDDKTLITRRNSLNGKVCTFDVNYQGGDTDIDVTMTMGDTMDETPKEGS